ncbi:MAG: efflux RND transporter periplasmic adaptor subunit [Porticoccaceae bacterium]
MNRLLIAFIATLLPLTATAFELQLSAEQLASAKLTSARAAVRELTPRLQLTATLAVDQRRGYRVAPVVDGVVAELLAVEHDRVRPGQVLARLRSQGLGQAQADYIEALARFELARGERTRLQELWQDGIVADSRWLTADSEYKAATAVLATRHRLLTLSGLGDGEIQQLGKNPGGLAVLELRSPGAGVVTHVEVQPGQLLAAGQTAFQIEDVSSLWAMVAIPVQRLAQISVGNRARISVPSSPGRSWDGTLESLGASVTADSQTASGRVVVANADGQLRPGLFAEVELWGATQRQLAVPATAVFRIGDQHFVFQALGEGRFEPVKVTPGAAMDGWTAIHSGLDADVEVVSEGVSSLKAHWQYQGGDQP